MEDWKRSTKKCKCFAYDVEISHNIVGTAQKKELDNSYSTVSSIKL